MLQDNFNGIFQELEQVPYVNTNRSPRVWPQFHEHLAISSCVKRRRISVPPLGQPLLHWSTKSFGAGAVLLSSLQTQILA